MSWQETAIRLGCRVETGVSLALLTSFHVGGPAEYVVTAPSAAAAALLPVLRAEKTPVLLLGNGTNILAADSGLRGVVLRLQPGPEPLQSDGSCLLCEAGASLKSACLLARDCGLSGLEPLFGIPGTVGGAVYMNAGAYGGQLADILEAVQVADPEGQITWLPAAAAGLSYRHSRFMETGEVILAARLRLTPDEPASVQARMENFQRLRREKQPLEYPSAGSFFKRPEGHFAGALIDACGLRGATVGGAQVSEKHAGFIINRGGASCRDILELAELVSRRVWENYGVRLEREVQLVGDVT